ncbi:MAG TPA: universal stress protein [Puia sp.]|jgi:nucleotide-binding universal stress UspA family protein|nr:universal stress protein [Puia sp.]
MKRILIAIDGGALSEKTARAGYDLAKATSAEIALVYVVDPEIVVGEGGYTAADLINISIQQGREILEKLKRDFGSENVWLFTEAGNPAKTIIKLTKDWNADIIVIGTHGRKGISHLLMGSVAEHVIRHSSVPVLVIPANFNGWIQQSYS